MHIYKNQSQTRMMLMYINVYFKDFILCSKISQNRIKMEYFISFKKKKDFKALKIM